jgi:hypothetical protein
MPVTINGSAGVTTNSGAIYNGIQSGTAVTASGTSVNFTGIPSWVKRITVMANAISTSGTSNYQVQLGDSGGVENTGYSGGLFTSSTFSAYSSGFIFNNNIASAASVYYGVITLVKFDGNAWMVTTACSSNATYGNGTGSGIKTLSATLDRIRITTVNGTDTFDAGSINILYE